MIWIDELALYWEQMAERVDDIAKAVGITVDENMGKEIDRQVSRGIQLFYLPPSADMSGGVDTCRDRNVCLIFVMDDADVQREGVMAVLARTQRTVLKVRDCLLADRSAGCHVMKIEPQTISIMPETSFYRSYVGWSMSFTAL